MRDLPASVRACLFDPDRVLTQAARLHAAAWKEIFDGYLRERADRVDAPLSAFDPVADYDEDVDGKAEHPQGKPVLDTFHSWSQQPKRWPERFPAAAPRKTPAQPPGRAPARWRKPCAEPQDDRSE